MSTSLFEELQEQMTLAVANLKRLNGATSLMADHMTSSMDTLAPKTETATASELINGSDEKTVTDTTVYASGGVINEPEIPETPVVKKKRATRKKAVKKVEEPVAKEEELDPLGNPINTDPEPDPEPIDVSQVRSAIQQVALALNGDTKKIVDKMMSVFGKGKLSEFKPEEYQKLIDTVESLTAKTATDVDPLA